MITKVVWNRLLPVLCALVLGGILAAGLWPFTAHPRNDVAWIAGGRGLHFGEHGTILSMDAFHAGDSLGTPSCTLELWFTPGKVQASNTMLAFLNRENLVSFSIYQSITDLLIQRQMRDAQGRVSEMQIYMDDAIRRKAPIFITITAGPQGTAFYVDGALVKSSSNFTFSRKDLVGGLVIGNSPVANDSWSGDLLGIAIYGKELSPAEVSEYSSSWIKIGRPTILQEDNPVALYLFDEGKGSLIRNHARYGPDLSIPDHYLILRPPFLTVPWKEYHPDWGYYQDILINIAGFIPFGFVFCAYLVSVRHLKRAVWIAILLGFTVSLTIEILQSFIPTRVSGMTDLITNTLGTAMGAAAYQWRIARAIFSRVGIQAR